MIATLPRHELFEISDDDALEFYPHAGQAAAWNATERIVAVIAGSQGGKTSFGPHWLQREIAVCGPGDYMVVTPTVPLMKLKALPEFLRLFRDILKLGVWHAGDQYFRYHRNADAPFTEQPTRVIFGSASNPQSLESATAKACWLDECGQDRFGLAAWEAVQRRTALAQGRSLITTTPYNLGWLKTQIYDRAVQGDRSIRVINFPSLLNPAYPRAEWEYRKARMDPWKFAMMNEGIFTKPAGLIYNAFEDSPRAEGGHIVTRAEFNKLVRPHWPRYGGLDFGAQNTARLMGVEDIDAHILYVYSESLQGNLSTREHTELMKGDVQGTELQRIMRENPNLTVEDIQRGNVRGVNYRMMWGGAPSEDQQRWDWAECGIEVMRPPIVDVESGIDKVIEVLKTWRVYFVDDLYGIRDEFARYKRKIDQDTGDVLTDIEDKNTFHRLDALRYLIAGWLDGQDMGLIEIGSITRDAPIQYGSYG